MVHVANTGIGRGLGLEVVELSCPAEHITLADVDMVLPTRIEATNVLPGSATCDPTAKRQETESASAPALSESGSNTGPKDFEWFNQQFVHSVAKEGVWVSFAENGWDRRDTEVSTALYGHVRTTAPV